jgi:phytoene dehydrogenase-like protein
MLNKKKENNMAPNNEHDAIVIGAGQNGLTAAAYLAKAGLDVVVLEAKSWIGGLTTTKEVTVPGFRHDLASTGLVFGLGNPVIAQDELGLISKYGLDLIDVKDPNIVNLYDDDTSLTLWTDIDKMCGEIAKFSQHDADAYRKFVATYTPLLPLLSTGMGSAAPSMGAFFNQLDQMPLGQELIRVMLMSAWDLARQWFEHPKTINCVLNYPSEAMVFPEQDGSAFYLLTLVLSQHVPGVHMKFPKGGMQAIPDALARCVKANGGTILTDQKVVKIVTKGGRVTGVVCANGEEYTARKTVIADVDPRLSLNQWLDTPLDSKLRDKINKIVDPAFSGLMTHVALDTDPTFKAGGDTKYGAQMCTLPSELMEFRTFFDDLRYGIPARKASKMLAVIPTRSDPSRAPEGKAVAYLWYFAPYYLANGGPEKWDSIKEEVSNQVMEKFFSFTTNISQKNVLGRYIISPLDYERNFPNAVHGQIMGPSPALYQNMAYRPVPELGQYRTPVDGLYITGQATHPGMGVNFGGRATIQIVMQDLGIDFDDVVS